MITRTGATLLETPRAPYVTGGEVTKSCRTCRFFRKETESWEMPHIWWFECDARPQNTMLRNFPFKRTTCRYWELRQRCNLGIDLAWDEAVEKMENWPRHSAADAQTQSAPQNEPGALYSAAEPVAENVTPEPVKRACVDCGRSDVPLSGSGYPPESGWDIDPRCEGCWEGQRNQQERRWR